MEGGLVSALQVGEPITKGGVAARIMEANLRAQKISVAIRTPEDHIGGMLKGVNEDGHRVLPYPAYPGVAIAPSCYRARGRRVVAALPFWSI